MKTSKILSLIIVLIPLVVQGQSLYNNTGILYVGPNTILFVADSIVNNGTLTNNGDIQIAGIWQNNATYEPGIGQLSLTSNQPQVINHNAQSFTRLTISGGGDKIFGADLYIENELDLTSGRLISTNGSRIFIEEGATIIGGSISSFIEGPVYHIGTGYKYFPIGVGNTYLPLELLDVVGTTPTIGVLLNVPNPNLEVVGLIQAVSDQQNWQLDVINGSFDGSEVILPLNNELFLESVNEGVVVQSEDLNSGFTNVGGRARTGDEISGSVTSATAVRGPYLTIGKIEVLPANEIFVYNAVSPNGDGMNDIFKIINIDLFPDNLVTIYTRWGDKVFEQAGYDNLEKIFEGKSNVRNNDLLQEGTYYYVIEKGDGSANVSGFLELRF